MFEIAIMVGHIVSMLQYGWTRVDVINDRWNSSAVASDEEDLQRWSHCSVRLCFSPLHLLGPWLGSVTGIGVLVAAVQGCPRQDTSDFISL